MKTEAPFTEEQVSNINEWQESGFVHRLTCPDNCDEFGESMFAIEIGMFCPQCDGLKQEWVPTGVVDGTLLASAKETQRILDIMREKPSKQFGGMGMGTF